MNFIQATLGMFRPKKRQVRQARYTFVPAQPSAEQLALPGFVHITVEQAAVLVTAEFPVTIVAREYNQLPKELQIFFKRGAK